MSFAALVPDISSCNPQTEDNNPLAELIRVKAFMSPMSGVTDLPFRLLIQKYGCRFAFTEMIDANGLFYKNKKTFLMLNRDSDKITYGAQIAGEDEEKILAAGKVCEEHGFKLLELNAGCPVKKVVKDGKGSALLKTPKKLGSIVDRLVKELSIPVTVKIRSGWDDNNLNYLETAKILEGSGAGAICIHPRTRTQMYKGNPDHNITRAIKETVNIPVFASGNIFTVKDFSNTLNSTKCDGAAIARGALGRPWLFNEINDYLSGKQPRPEPSFKELKNIILEHVSLCMKYYEPEKIFQKMHKHMQWYLRPFKNRHPIMLKYTRIKYFDEFEIFLDNLELDNQGRLFFKEI